MAGIRDALAHLSFHTDRRCIETLVAALLLACLRQGCSIRAHDYTVVANNATMAGTAASAVGIIVLGRAMYV